MTDDSDNPFLTIDETAELLRVNRRTLDNLRWREEGPPFRRHGGRIVYHRDEVLAWSEQRRARTPPDPSHEAPAARNGHARPRPAPAGVPQTGRSDISLEHQP
jgi:predicted DNA-binding transcriptional regulator AlpA